MSPKFNIDRPKVSDEEIKKRQDFNELVERFKQQSLKKAQGDESWWKNKMIRYSTVIAGATVVCTITYSALFNQQQKPVKTHETLTTQNSTPKPRAKAGSPCVNTPSPRLKTPYTAYKINNAKGGQITHTTSSRINVPKNSFVDKQGKEIVGEVTIEYREFHDIGDLIVNGIPMAYDSLGTRYNLETAGMFDIRGSQGGEPVFIKAGNNLEVELASINAEQRFNQYYLDTLERNWKYLQKDHAVPVSRNDAPAGKPLAESQKTKALKKEISELPRKADSVQALYTTRAGKLSRPKEPVQPVKYNPVKPSFRLDGSYNEFPELAAFNNVIFEVGPENRNYSKSLHDITWSDIKISQGPVKGRNYLLTLSYRNRSEKLIVYPVLSGEDYSNAEKDYEKKLETYQELIEKRNREEQRLMAEMQAKQAAYLADQKKKEDELAREKAALMARYNLSEQRELASAFNTLSTQVKATRLFRISSFGIYNSDCPHPVPEGGSMTPLFSVQDKKENRPLRPDHLYLIDHTNKTVYTLSAAEGFTFHYDPKSSYSLCLFSRNEMYVCNKSLFQQTLENGRNTFVVSPLPARADNLADFKKILEI